MRAIVATPSQQRESRRSRPSSLASLGLGVTMEQLSNTATTRSCSSGWRMGDPSSIRSTIFRRRRPLAFAPQPRGSVMVGAGKSRQARHEPTVINPTTSFNCTGRRRRQNGPQRRPRPRRAGGGDLCEAHNARETRQICQIDDFGNVPAGLLRGIGPCLCPSSPG